MTEMMRRILSEPIGNQAPFIRVFWFQCQHCGGGYLGPGSQPVSCPHQREGLCLSCYRSKEAWMAEQTLTAQASR